MSVRLVYYLDNKPGITRKRRGKGFSFVAPDGTTIARGPERKRLMALAVPPAYGDVWISPLENGHLQATGRDQRKRKQYRYHPDWASAQARTKFDALVEFGTVLPRIRRRVARDLNESPGDREFALASAVMLIDRLALRVGSEDYRVQNGSYGALTLRGRHLRLNGEKISLSFKAKGGQRVRRQTSSKTLARALHDAHDLPGAELLSWIDDDGAARALNAGLLNAYLSDAAGCEHITAKTFRTWAGTVAAFEIGAAGGATIKAMSEAAAERLHNTPTIARTSYVHPDVIDLADGKAVQVETPRMADLMASETRLLGFLSA